MEPLHLEGTGLRLRLRLGAKIQPSAFSLQPLANRREIGEDTRIPADSGLAWTARAFMSEKIAIYIPAYNAAATLPRVLERIPDEVKRRVDEIFVVDNDSADNTWLVAEGCRHIQHIPNLEIIRNPKNLGYGGSQKVAYRRCIDRGYRCVAMLHGDAQYAPELLTNLIDPVVRGEADLMFGSRMQGDPLGGGMPLHRYWGNRFLTTSQNRVTDSPPSSLAS